MSERRRAPELGVDEERLERAPGTYSFFQAVVLLERLMEDSAPVGGFSRPSAEAVRFGAHPSFAFPTAEIEALELEEEDPPRMTVNFMGLVGPQGVMPAVYTQRVIEREAERDTGMRDFLDIFHHRFVSLFYRAWRKHRVELDARPGETDVVTDHLLDLVGIGPEQVRASASVPPPLMAAYAGLLAPMQRSAVGLEQLLRDHFDVPAEVQQFVGGWYPMSDRDRLRLGDDDVSTQLGRGAAVGDEIRDRQARVRIVLGPLERADFDRLLPGGTDHERLRSLVRWYAHDQFQFEVQLVLAGPEVPPVVLGAGGDDVPALGLRTWIRSAPRTDAADETLFRL